MPNDLAQVVAEKMQTFPIEKQQRVLEFVESIEETEKPKKQSLLEKLEAISKRVPDEVWEKLPVDGAENIDHYLYGAPKKKEMNDRVFADTLYWVAVLNPKDQWHRQAIETRRLFGDIKIVTTETVLIEVLNYFSEHGSQTRKSAVDAVRTIMIDEEVEYVSHSPEIFLDALDLYESRLDKGYSLTDCVSMLTMKNLGVREILTHDNHFEQENLTILL